MRGGRFQQKATEDANARSAEALFEAHSAAEIREVESQTRREIEAKKEELRQLVGASYRDLIESADSIVSMKKSCCSVAENIKSMENGFALLRQTSSAAHPSLIAATPDLNTTTTTTTKKKTEKKRREELFGVGSRVKYIVDTPEKIWGCLDEHMYLEGARRYFRAREVHSLLSDPPKAKKREKAELLTHFPLIRHQWPLVETFRGQISQRSRDRLFEPGLEPNQYAVALAAVAAIDELNSSQILALFLDSRRAWLKSHLRIALATRERARTEKRPIESSIDNVTQMSDIAEFLAKALNIVQISLCHVGQLFREVNEDPPLFFSTVLSFPPSSQLFGGIPNPEEEIRLWKLHREKLESTMVPLSGNLISASCLSWIQTCEEDLSKEGRSLLELFGQLRDLAEVEKRVKEEVGNPDAFKGSMEWLRSAFGQVIDSPWGCISGLLLNEDVDLWSTLLDRLFVTRAKAIIDSLLTSVTVKDMVENTILSISPLSHLHLPDSATRKSGATSITERNLKSEEGLAKWKLREYDVDSFALSTSYLGQEVVEIKEEIDGKLKRLFEDLKSFLHGQSRIEELGSYFQEQCFECISSIVGDLQEKLTNLYDEMKKASRRSGKALNMLRNSFEKLENSGKIIEFAEANVMEMAGLVEKALFLGRLFVALAHHSSSIPAVLQSPSLSSNEESSHTESPLLSMGNRQSWSEVEKMAIGSHFNTYSKSRHGRASATELDKSSKLSKLRLALRHSSLLAHCMWISWSTEELCARLARDLQNDDALSSSSPLKGWEETLIRQENEDGTEIEMKVPLPALPSTYISTFLFTGCREIYRIGGHVLDKTILHLFVQRLLEKVLSIYEKFISEAENPKDEVSEKGFLQLSFDLRFLGDVLSGGESTYKSLDFLNEDNTVDSLVPASLVVKSRQMIFQVEPVIDKKKLLSGLLKKLTNKLDPIDWATYESFLWENEKNAYKSNAVLLGFFVQLNRLHTGSFQKSSSSEPNILKMSSAIPRFSYLPISTPSLSRKTAVTDESLGRSWRSHANGENSKAMFEDDSDMNSALVAKPLFRSFMNQVGSRLGDGTFKLGSMLTDGQVSRLKDRSAAAISTFGDILPVQAAGLFSSFTAGSS